LKNVKKNFFQEYLLKIDQISQNHTFGAFMFEGFDDTRIFDW